QLGQVDDPTLGLGDDLAGHHHDIAVDQLDARRVHGVGNDLAHHVPVGDLADPRHTDQSDFGNHDRAQKSIPDSSGMDASDRFRASSQRSRRDTVPGFGSTTTRGDHVAARSSSPFQVPMAKPAMKAAPRVVASRTGETSTARPVASARAWTKVLLALIPPSMRRDGMLTDPSASAASTRSAPRWATPSSTALTTWARFVPLVRPSSVPRAPKSHSGVPMPSSAGTNQTSPLSSTP